MAFPFHQLENLYVRRKTKLLKKQDTSEIVKPSEIIGPIQRPYDFKVFFPYAGFTDLKSSRRINDLCQACSVDDYSFGSPELIKAGLYDKNFPGRLNSKMANFQFVIPTPDIVSSYFNKWRGLILQESFYSATKDYKKSITVALVDRKDEVTNKIILRDCYPLNTYSYSFTFEQERRMLLAINIKFDRIYPESGTDITDNIFNL
jgi:hypothetical protein